MKKANPYVLLSSVAVLVGVATCNMATSRNTTINTAGAATACVNGEIMLGLSSPVGMAVEASGDILVAEWSADRVSRISLANGKKKTLADVPTPSGLLLTKDGRLLVASYGGNTVYEIKNGKATPYISGLATPAGLTQDAKGNVLIANRRTDEILRITQSGGTEKVIGGLATPVAAIERSDKSFVVSNITGTIVIVAPDGSRDVISTLKSPAPGMVLLPDDSVILADYGGSSVYRLVGNKLESLSDGYSSPVGLAPGPGGNSVYVADWGRGALYRLCITKGRVPEVKK